MEATCISFNYSVSARLFPGVLPNLLLASQIATPVCIESGLDLYPCSQAARSGETVWCSGNRLANARGSPMALGISCCWPVRLPHLATSIQWLGRALQTERNPGETAKAAQNSGTRWGLCMWAMQGPGRGLLLASQTATPGHECTMAGQSSPTRMTGSWTSGQSSVLQESVSQKQAGSTWLGHGLLLSIHTATTGPACTAARQNHPDRQKPRRTMGDTPVLGECVRPTHVGSTWALQWSAVVHPYGHT